MSSRYCDLPSPGLAFLGVWRPSPAQSDPGGTCFFFLQGGVLLSAPRVGSWPLGLSIGCSRRLQVPQGLRLAFHSAFLAV